MVTKIERYKAYLIDWLYDWFKKNGDGCKAVVGVSGGKDSSVIAALCVEALGKDRVLGVLMPNGIQSDIDDSYALCEHLGIEYVRVNINTAYSSILVGLDYNGITASTQTKVNLGPRLRMTTLYAVAQSVNGRVVGTSNLDETMLGWCTRFGDNAADVEPIIKMHVDEVVELGLALGLPENLVKKAPADGLTAKTDEDNFGFTYAEFKEFFEKNSGISTTIDKQGLTEKEQKMLGMFEKSEFKRKPIPEPKWYPCVFEDGYPYERGEK